MFRILKKSLTTGIVTGRYAEPATPPSPPDAQAVEHTRPFRRSLAIRAVDTGSCNACEMELNALMNPVYDAERFGIHIAASPRHADALVVTGPVTVASKNRTCSTRGPSTQPTGLIAPVGLMHQAAWARTSDYGLQLGHAESVFEWAGAGHDHAREPRHAGISHLLARLLLTGAETDSCPCPLIARRADHLFYPVLLSGPGQAASHCLRRPGARRRRNDVHSLAHHVIVSPFLTVA